MTDNTLEHVARAIHAKMGGKPFDSYGAEAQERLLALARAAIQALIDNVSEEMIEAGFDAKAPGEHLSASDFLRMTFQAMLTASMGEK